MTIHNIQKYPMKKDTRILKNLLFGAFGQLLTMALALFIPQ